MLATYIRRARNIVFRPVLLASCLGSAPCYALDPGCKCVPPNSARSGLSNSTHVFVGYVIERTKIAVPEIAPGYKELRITFKVREYWKGTGERTVVIRTPELPEHCGFDYKNDYEYLVYASGSPAPLSDVCTRSIHITNPQAKADKELLGPSKFPEGVE